MLVSYIDMMYMKIFSMQRKYEIQENIRDFLCPYRDPETINMSNALKIGYQLSLHVMSNLYCM